MKHEITINEYFILYMDILGYIDKFNTFKSEASKEVEYLNQIIEVVNDACFTKKKFKEIKVKVFSDNLLFVSSKTKDVKRNNNKISQLCHLASRLQEMYLRRYGVLFRGSISCGRIYFNNKFVFGSGICEAYKLEVEKAVYPRIIIDKSLYNYDYIINSLYTVDKNCKYDSYYFINFLNYYSINNKSRDKNKDELIKRIINLKKETTESRAQIKVNWVYEYCREKNIFK